MLFRKIEPVLPAMDLERSIQFYETTLGFTLVHADDEYAVLGRDEVGLHLWKTDDEKLGKTSACRIEVDDVRAAYDSIGKSVSPHADIERKPWGTTEFAVLDPAGVLVWLVGGE